MAAKRKRNVATTAEYRFALKFLKALHGDTQNNLLVTAVIAWMRAEGGKSWVGNNPFNQIAGKDDAKFRIGTRTGKRGVKYSVYANTDMAVRAAVYRLTHGNSEFYRDIRATLRQRNASEKGQLAAGRDFLDAVARSPWNSTHYGYVVILGVSITQNSLLNVWASITGLPALTKTVPPKRLKPAHQKPAPVRDLQPPPERPGNYIDGFAILAFYNERHRMADVLPTGLDVGATIEP